jgi:2-polyprenyl-3-methyl-5-hydroxy-6-metoxy-1,4-benzoquinol methylase
MEKIDEVANKITVLEFELNHLIDLVINQSQERWLPGLSSRDTHEAHTNRYKWVSEYVKNKNILDIACGTGFGSMYLAKEGLALKVLGGDCSKSAVQYCKVKHNMFPNLEFSLLDAEKFILDEKKEVIISFETIEHLHHPELLLKNCVNCLTDNGLFFISTPVSKKDIDKNPLNPHHLIEWNIEEFINMVEKYFLIDVVYIQPYTIPNSGNASLISRILKKIKKIIYRNDMDFMSFSIYRDNKNLNIWQKLIKLDLIGAYVILQCKKKI